MKRKKRSPETIYNDLKGSPERIILTFQYPLDDQNTSEQMVKVILTTFRKEIQDGIVDYFKKKKDGSMYFILYWTPETSENPS